MNLFTFVLIGALVLVIWMYFISNDSRGSESKDLSDSIDDIVVNESELPHQESYYRSWIISFVDEVDSSSPLRIFIQRPSFPIYSQFMNFSDNEIRYVYKLFGTKSLSNTILEGSAADLKSWVTEFNKWDDTYKNNFIWKINKSLKR